jgi:uncharacterized membrane protein YkgB
MNNQDIPKLPLVISEEYDNMTDEQKRTYLLQLKQEDTMEWQKLASQIYVYSFCIGIISVGIYLFFKFV